MSIIRALLIVLAGCLLWIVLHQGRLVFPTPQTETAFLETYRPTAVLDRFKAAPNSQMVTSASDGAGREFVTHDRYFERVFVINAQDWVALMQALRDDVTEQLASRRFRILDQTTGAIDGFQIKYAAGRSQGSVVVESLQSVEPYQFGIGPAPGKVPVKLKIHVSEKWRVNG